MSTENNPVWSFDVIKHATNGSGALVVEHVVNKDFNDMTFYRTW